MSTEYDTGNWPQARATALLLRNDLAELGIPAEVVRQILPLGDIGGGEHIRMGTWPVDAARLLLARLLGRPVEEPAP
ncbi:MAG: hypothetical protein HOW97_34135 [Catenulispora sp.]|nr:hypothetical protein [Catenulispora sp.]